LNQAKRDFTTHSIGDARFAARLQAFCSLERRKEVGSSEEERRVHAALRTILRIDNEFFDGLRELAAGLTNLAVFYAREADPLEPPTALSPFSF
jgi:hypothetical protein